TISANLNLQNYITDLSLTTYDFKVSAGTDLATKAAPDIESTGQQVRFTSRCARQNPTVTLTPSSYSFIVPYGKTLSDSKQFTVNVKNNDAEGCGTSRFIINVGSSSSITATHNQPAGVLIVPGTTDSNTAMTATGKDLPKGTWAPTITFINQNALQEESKTYSDSANANFIVSDGEKPCERKPPEVSISNSQPVFPGFSIEYTATIRNMDGSNCDSSNFKFDSLRGIPISWQFTMDQKTVGINAGGSGTLKFGITSSPASDPRAYSMTVCFSNMQTGKSNCETGVLHGGSFYYTIKSLTGADTQKPTITVSLDPENPYPNAPATFKIMTSDNEQMKSIKLFIGPNLEKEWSLKDPETTTTYSKAFSQGKYGYYAVATDYKDNQARFPETGLQQIDVKDRPDLSISSITAPIPKPEETVTVTLKAANTGTVAASNVKVKLEIAELSFSEDKTLSIPAANSQPVTFDVKFSRAGDYTLKAIIDPGNAVEEASENNNVLTQKVSVGKTTITLYKGQNIVGFLPSASEMTSCRISRFASGSQAGCMYQRPLVYYDAGSSVNGDCGSKYKSSDAAQPGIGYYILVSEDCSITPTAPLSVTVTLYLGQNIISAPVQVPLSQISSTCGSNSIGKFASSSKSGCTYDKPFVYYDAGGTATGDCSSKFKSTDTMQPYLGYFVYFLGKNGDGKTACSLTVS
ncbi:hypothetical protein EPN87_04360, partial [archaeon]